jgi:hypothetical protein
LVASAHFPAEAGKGGSHREERDRKDNEGKIVHALIIAQDRAVA